MVNEIWKDIEEYEGLYQVSNIGRVKSLYRIVEGGRSKNQVVPERILSTPVNSRGYPIVMLRNRGKKKSINVHRLVAMTFIPNPNRLPQVNHRDEDKCNNHVSNLEWCNSQYNNTYGTAQNRSSRTKKIPVLKCDDDGNVLAEYESALDAEKETGISRAHISQSCRKVKYRTRAGGFVWKYKE